MAQAVYLGSNEQKRRKMTISQDHYHQTEDTEEEEWGVVSKGLVFEGKEAKLGMDTGQELPY